MKNNKIVYIFCNIFLFYTTHKNMKTQIKYPKISVFNLCLLY